MRRSLPTGLIPFAAACLAVGLGNAALSAGAFDGTYRGAQKTIRSNNAPGCTNMDRANVVVRIADNRFTRSWGVHSDGKGDELDVVVAPDGSFKAQTASMSDRSTRHGVRAFEISGKIVGGMLEADLGSNLCAVHLSLKKS